MSERIGVSLQARGDVLVARITLDNPRKLNCLDRRTLAGLIEQMRAVERDARVRAVVLTGAGERSFSGGANLDDLAALDATSARQYIGQVHDACAALRDCAVPVIARINGWCLGAGLELAAACDLRIAADSARFGMPEVRLGIPSVIEAALLPRLVGAGRARWLVLTGETIGAEQALAWGLLERVAPAAALDEAVNAALDAILAGGPDAVRAQKRLCKLWEEAPLDQCVRLSIDEFARSYESGEPARRIEDSRRARRKAKEKHR